MSAAPLPQSFPTTPESPCLECVLGKSHVVSGHGLTVCDPIMAGIGAWVSKREAAIEAQVAEMVARAHELRKKNR